MMQAYVLAMFFLYFPEDKTEYIPAVIKLVIFAIAAFLVMRMFIKISKKEAKKAEELERQLKISTDEKNS